MDEESEGSVAHEKPKKLEFLEPGVTRIKPQKRFSTLISILIRLSLASLFLAAGVGAVVYSVIHSAELEAAEDPQHHHHTHKDYFKFYHDQSCFAGILTIEFQRREDFGSKKTVQKIGVSWIQDDTHKRIVHRIGLSEADWQYTFFVYDRYTVLATKGSCVRTNQTYYSFLKGFGLSALPKVRKERIVLDKEVNEEPTSVELYQGEPATDPNSRNAYQWINGTTVKVAPPPYLATAFTQPQQKLVYGWQAYFQTSEKSNIHWMEFWFPNMTSVIPDAALFFEYPTHCLASTVET